MTPSSLDIFQKKKNKTLFWILICVLYDFATKSSITLLKTQN